MEWIDTSERTSAERGEMYQASVLETANTSIADYVWLPIEWGGRKPILRWHDEWRLEDY